MESGELVRYNYEKYRSNEALLFRPAREFWLVPKNTFQCREYIESEVHKWCEKEGITRLKDKVAYLCTKYTKEIVLNLTKNNYIRNIYDVAMDLTEQQDAIIILSHFQRLFKQRSYLLEDSSDYPKDFVDELMELSLPTSAFSYFNLTNETVHDHEAFTQNLCKHTSEHTQNILIRLFDPQYRSAHSRQKDTYIAMENYYLALILKYEAEPEKYAQEFDPMILARNQNHVTRADTEKWKENQFQYFLDNLQETNFIPGLIMGWAESCSQISLKFYEGPTEVLEKELARKLQKSEEYLNPVLKSQRGIERTTGNHEMMFAEKYAYFISGQEHLLEIGQMVAVSTLHDDDPRRKWTSWDRAITLPCEFFNLNKTFYERRVHWSHRTVRPQKPKKKSKRKSRDEEEPEEPVKYGLYFLKVYFVDYGQVEEVSTSNVRLIDKSFLQYSAFAMRIFLSDERTRHDPEKYHNDCDWNTCLGYELVVDKLTTDVKTNVLVAKIDQVEKLQQSQATFIPTAQIYKKANFKGHWDVKKYTKLEPPDYEGAANVWFNNRLEKLKDKDGNCLKQK